MQQSNSLNLHAKTAGSGLKFNTFH